MKRKYNFIQRASHLCNLCADDELRPILSNIYFDEGNAICSDGHILLVIPVVEISNLDGADIEKLNGKMLNKAAFRYLLKFDRVSEIDDEGICAEMKGINNPYKVKINFAESGRYPDYKYVMNVEQHEVDKEISLKPSRLEELCKAVGDDMPRLTPNGGHAILIRFRESKAKGLQMPCLISENVSPKWIED